MMPGSDGDGRPANNREAGCLGWIGSGGADPCEAFR